MDMWLPDEDVAALLGLCLDRERLLFNDCEPWDNSSNAENGDGTKLSLLLELTL
jgi:hypothetical protein